MSSRPVLDLAAEVANSRDSDVPIKLLKLKEILAMDDITKKIKYDIYKFDLLEALSVTFKHDYGHMKDGWSIAVELVKIFCQCTTDFSVIEKQYETEFLPRSAENVLILAKKIQEKYIKTKGFTDEFLGYFQTIMQEYAQININNPNIALKSLKSQRLSQLLVSDEQNTSAMVMTAIKEIFQAKKKLISQLDEKTIHLFLDEAMYKLVISDINKVGLRYKGLKMLLDKWYGRGVSRELNEFLSLQENYSKMPDVDSNLENSALIIQRNWRGYETRKKLDQADKSFKKLHQTFRARKERRDEERLKKMARDELTFQLLLEHRRRQRRRKMELAAIIEILPPNQIETYFQKQREYSARIIQANYRGYRQRKLYSLTEMADKRRHKAAVLIQRAFRRHLERVNKRRQQPAFYSRPPGLDAEKREFLLDKIRKHLDSLPPHPRDEKKVLELHERAQRAFQNYVQNQRTMRQQQHQIELQLAISSADADLLLDCPKLAQVNEDDIKNFYSHKSVPIMLAAKEAHKRTLRKQRAKWYELLDDSDNSDNEDLYQENIDDITNCIKNLKFNAETNNYYTNKSDRIKLISGGASSDLDDFYRQQQLNYHESSSSRAAVATTIPKRERNQLKTAQIRKTVSHMMATEPTKSHVWNAEPFDRVNSTQLK